MYASIGKRIRRLREAAHMTQEQLAEKADISLSFMGHIERGTRKASVETLHHLMLALNCSANDIFGSLTMQPAEYRISDQLMEIAQVLREEGK